LRFFSKLCVGLFAAMVGAIKGRTAYGVILGFFFRLIGLLVVAFMSPNEKEMVTDKECMRLAREGIARIQAIR
jgi:hypothetical protein